MLKRLTVENYALIDSLEVVWDSHLNIITGETGAGKSILLGALQLLLGARCDSESVKDNSKNCVIEAEFEVSEDSLSSFFEENDIDADSTLIVRRVISPAGKSRAFINDQPVQISTLKSLASLTIDIHSQHENLIICSPAFRLRAIDTMAQCQDLVQKHRELFARLSKLRTRLGQIRQDNALYASQQEWLRHEVQELDQAELREGETAELEAELKILENADLIRSTLYALSEVLEGDESSVIPTLKEQSSRVAKISEHYASASEYASRLKSVEIELKDIASTASQDAERMESDPKRLEAVSSRLSQIFTLEQKHKVSSEEELIAIRDRFRDQLSAIDRGSEDISALENEIREAESQIQDIADSLHKRRLACSKGFAEEVERILRKVGLEDASISIELVRVPIFSEGYDQAEFMFSSSHASTPSPIDRIASGGEMARVMLALKSILARKLELPTVIFDEIDTGVSGPIANAVGDVVNELSENMQVINITHLPQVASKGNSHMLVYKSEGHTTIRRLGPDERIQEIAKMLSANRITEEAVAQARNLLFQK